MQIDDLKTLRQKLPRGWSIALRKATGRGRDLISKVLNGHVENPKILKAAVRLAQQEETRKEREKLELAQLVATIKGEEAPTL